MQASFWRNTNVPVARRQLEIGSQIHILDAVNLARYIAWEDGMDVGGRGEKQQKGNLLCPLATFTAMYTYSSLTDASGHRSSDAGHDYPSSGPSDITGDH